MSSSLFVKARRSPFARRVMLVGTSLLSILNRVIPKRDNLVLFYESSRPFPQDNTEAMCSWLLDNDIERRYEAWYCVGAIPAGFESRGVKRCSPARAAFLYLRAGHVFFSFGGLRIRPARGQCVVNLWHGSPLKTIGKMTGDPQYDKEDLRDFTALSTAAPHFVPVMAEAFGVEEDDIKVTGYPRCDYLASRQVVEAKILRSAPMGSRKILWMPTFRISHDRRFENGRETGTGLPLVEDVLDLCRINEVLTEAGCFMVVKGHPYAAAPSFGDFSNIAFVTDADLYCEGIRLYEFVSRFDALLTDYSSVYFDWLLLDRPVGFIVDDFEEYRDTRGFGFDDPLSLMPGPKVRSLDELVEFVRDVSTGRDAYREERLTIKQLTNTYNRGFCMRVAELAGIRPKKTREKSS